MTSIFFSVSRCVETLCQKTIQVLVQSMLACARKRTWIPVEWPTSLGDRLYVYKSHRLDRRPVHSHIISRDSESLEKGSRYCCEGAEKGQTWRVGVHTGSRSVVK
jgi:hypothetical protein